MPPGGISTVQALEVARDPGVARLSALPRVARIEGDARERTGLADVEPILVQLDAMRILQLRDEHPLAVGTAVSVRVALEQQHAVLDGGADQEVARRGESEDARPLDVLGPDRHREARGGGHPPIDGRGIGGVDSVTPEQVPDRGIDGEALRKEDAAGRRGDDGHDHDDDSAQEAPGSGRRLTHGASA